MDHRGMTLVELMITLAILCVVLGASWGIFYTQMRGAHTGINRLTGQQDPRTMFKLWENDFAMAGFGQDGKLAFYIRDASQTSDQNDWSDAIFFSDWNFLGGDEIKSSERQKNSAATIVRGSGTASVTLDKLDLDNYGFGYKKLTFPFFKEHVGDSTAPTNYDNCYGENCTANCGNSGGKTCSLDEFAGGIWQTVITNAGINKVARIKSIAGTTLNLDKAVNGNKIAPAIYYCLDEGDNPECDTDNSTRYIIKMSNRSSGGRQPLADHIIDMQIAYRSSTGTWYCDGIGPCPMYPFNPENIDLIRISLISKYETADSNATIPKCRWLDQTRHTCTPKNGSGYFICISAENGNPWGCEVDQSGYNKTQFTIVPWNSALQSKLNKTE